VANPHAAPPEGPASVLGYVIYGRRRERSLSSAPPQNSQDLGPQAEIALTT